MNVNNSINTNDTNFKARLYLKNINKNEQEFFKGVAKDFHHATKDLKGASFTLKDEGDKFAIISNQCKDNFGLLRKDGLNQNKKYFLDSLVTAAKSIRFVEQLCPCKDNVEMSTMRVKGSTSALKALLEMFKKNVN